MTCVVIHFTQALYALTLVHSLLSARALFPQDFFAVILGFSAVRTLQSLLCSLLTQFMGEYNHLHVQRMALANAPPFMYLLATP